MQNTPNLNLRKPDADDNAKIEDLNYNADTLDKAIGEHTADTTIHTSTEEKTAITEAISKNTQDIAKNTTAITQTAKDLGGHANNQATHLITLTHSKSGTVHTLTGIPTTSGIYTAQFKATADYLQGNTFNGYTAKPVGEDTAMPNKAFVTGDLVTVVVDIQSKKLGFKLGGGGVNDTLPSQVKNLTTTAGNAKVTLSWTNSTTGFAGLLIMRKVGSQPIGVKDGTKVYEGTGVSFVDTGVINDTTYYYRAFPYNAKKQYQTDIVGAVVSAKPVAGLLLGNLPVGTLVKALNSKYYSVPVVWRIADKNHSGYPANSVTLIADKILTLKCFDGKEPSNTDNNRLQYGNNRYIYANMRRWLNSDAGAGAWYAAQHFADAPPNAAAVNNNNPYDTQAGFLNAFSTNFRNALLTTTLTVARNTVVDGGSYETFNDKLFLASNTEVGLANENGVVEGTKLALFTDNASRVATPTVECVSNGRAGTVGSEWYWWLRTPYASYSFIARYVGPNGVLGDSYAYVGNWGVRPLCNLSSSVLTSLAPDNDGAYILTDM